MTKRTAISPRTLKPNQIAGRVVVAAPMINRALRRKLIRERRQEAKQSLYH